MKRDKNHKIIQGHIFTKTAYYKLWRIYCRLNKVVGNPAGVSYPQNNSYYSPEWFKKSILPSKAFSYWLAFYKKRKLLSKRIELMGKKYLPESVKKYLKNHLIFIFSKSDSLLPKQIVMEWNKWINLRQNKSVDIINFSIISYDFRFQRPQHLDNGLIDLGHRVFYIENEFINSPSAKYPQIAVEKKNPNLFAIKLSSSKNYFIYQDSPSAKDRKIIIASLKLLIEEAQIINPVAKIDHPFWAAIAEELKMPIIYDAMDLHEGFKENSNNNVKNEKFLLDKSDLILASSDYLAHRFKKYSQKTLLLRNAGEYDHFSIALKGTGLSTPKDMLQLKGPVIGYYGALADWLNTDLIEKLAKDFPDASIVMIGRVTNPVLESLAIKYTNIHLLGEKKYQDLPRYLKHFDVCLIPFQLIELIKATNPVKIYEYFAAGKPVVATSIPELLPYKKLIYLADTPDSYSKAVKQALLEKSKLLPKQRQKVARENTWKIRSAELNKRLPGFFPSVSVIVLVYNNARLSKISIDSVLKRSKYPNLKLIIVDNKSDNKTVKMLQQYVGKKDIKLIFNKENYGFAKGNNIGMKAAKGEYLLLLNNDVRVTPGWIERLVYYAQATGVGLVGPVTNSIGNEARIDIFYDPDVTTDVEEQALDYTSAHWGETLELERIAAFAWLKPRSVYEKIGDLDDRFGRGLFEDDDYCVRVLQAGLKILCAEDSFVHHYGGASTGWGTPAYQKLFNENKDKFEKKWKAKWTPHRHRKK